MERGDALRNHIEMGSVLLEVLAYPQPEKRTCG